MGSTSNSKGNSPQVEMFHGLSARWLSLKSKPERHQYTISFIQCINSKFQSNFYWNLNAKVSTILVIPLNFELVIKKWFNFITTQSLFKEPHERRRSRCKKINFHLIEQLAINWTSSNVKENLTFLAEPPHSIQWRQKMKRFTWPARSIDWSIQSHIVWSPTT